MFPDRLKTLEANIAELHMIMEKYSIEDIKDDLTKQWALRYGLFESIQNMINTLNTVIQYTIDGNVRYAFKMDTLWKKEAEQRLNAYEEGKLTSVTVRER